MILWILWSSSCSLSFRSDHLSCSLERCKCGIWLQWMSAIIPNKWVLWSAGRVSISLKLIQVWNRFLSLEILTTWLHYQTTNSGLSSVWTMLVPGFFVLYSGPTDPSSHLGIYTSSNITQSPFFQIISWGNRCRPVPNGPMVTSGWMSALPPP